MSNAELYHKMQDKPQQVKSVGLINQQNHNQPLSFRSGSNPPSSRLDNSDLIIQGVNQRYKAPEELWQEEEDRAQARVRIAQFESAERVKKFKKKENKQKKVEEEDKAKKAKQRGKSENREVKEKLFHTYQPSDEPAFFDLAIEKRHVDHLSRKTLDKEHKLQIVYRILKD